MNIEELREKYNAVTATHFKTLIKELVDHSVDEVIRKLPKKKQTEYLNM